MLKLLPSRRPCRSAASKPAQYRLMVAPQAASASSSRIHGDIKTVLFSEKAIADRCIALGKTLAADFADRQPLVVVTLAGACMFASELLKRLEPVPEGLHVDFIRASSYGASTTSSGSVDVQAGQAKIPCKGRHVLFVEDIVDTGHTLQRLMQHAQREGAASTAVVAMLDKVARREVDVDIAYTGFSCPDEFVVGYGLDYNEQYRSLPYVGVLTEEAQQR